MGIEQRSTALTTGVHDEPLHLRPACLAVADSVAQIPRFVRVCGSYIGNIQGPRFHANVGRESVLNFNHREFETGQMPASVSTRGALRVWKLNNSAHISFCGRRLEDVPAETAVSVASNLGNCALLELLPQTL